MGRIGLCNDRVLAAIAADQAPDGKSGDIAPLGHLHRPRFRDPAEVPA